MMMTGLVPLMMNAAFAAVTALLMVLVTATATSLMHVVCGGEGTSLAVAMATA